MALHSFTPKMAATNVDTDFPCLDVRVALAAVKQWNQNTSETGMRVMNHMIKKYEYVASITRHLRSTNFYQYKTITWVTQNMVPLVRITIIQISRLK